MSFLVKLRFMHEGAWWIAYLFIVTKVSDVGAFLIGSKRPAKYLWVSYVSSLSIGALVLGYALFRYLSTGDSGDFPIELVVGLVIYTGSVIITLAAAVFTAVKAFWPTKRTRP